MKLTSRVLIETWEFNCICGTLNKQHRTVRKYNTIEEYNPTCANCKAVLPRMPDVELYNEDVLTLLGTIS